MSGWCVEKEKMESSANIERGPDLGGLGVGGDGDGAPDPPTTRPSPDTPTGICHRRRHPQLGHNLL